MQNYLLFTVEHYHYGISVKIVKEIIRITAFKPIPDQPIFVEGVINLRGRVIPLVDFRRRFLMGITEKSIDKRIVICTISDFLVGFLVDSVEEVFAFADNELKDVSNEDLGLDFRFIDKIAIRGSELISILNANRIFSKDEIDNLLSMYSKKIPETPENQKITEPEKKMVKPSAKKIVKPPAKKTAGKSSTAVTRLRTTKRKKKKDV